MNFCIHSNSLNKNFFLSPLKTHSQTKKNLRYRISLTLKSVLIFNSFLKFDLRFIFGKLDNKLENRSKLSKESELSKSRTLVVWFYYCVTPAIESGSGCFYQLL